MVGDDRQAGSSSTPSSVIGVVIRVTAASGVAGCARLLRRGDANEHQQQADEYEKYERFGAHECTKP